MELLSEEKVKRLYLGLRAYKLFQIFFEMEEKPYLKIKNCYRNVSAKEGVVPNEKDYLGILNNFYLIGAINYFSLVKDEYLDVINNQELEKSEFDFEHLFVDKKDCNKFSKKQIIKCIRDAFNHSSDKLLYKIIDDDKIEIKLEGINPVFHVIVSCEDLFDLAYLMRGYTKHIGRIIIKGLDDVDLKGNLYSELDKVRIERISTKSNEITDEDFSLYSILRYFPSRKVEKIENGELPLISNDRSPIELKYSYYEYKLSDLQKSSVVKLTNKYVQEGLLNIESEDVKRTIMDYIIRQTLPHPINSVDNILGLLAFIELPMRCWNYSLEQLLENEDKRVIDPDNIYVLDRILVARDEKFTTALAILATYFLSNYAKEEKMVINNKEIDLEKVRNSFVHGRWSVMCMNDTKVYVLYDHPNGKRNELNYNYIQVYTLDEILEILKFLIKREKDIINNLRRVESIANKKTR